MGGTEMATTVAPFFLVGILAALLLGVIAAWVGWLLGVKTQAARLASSDSDSQRLAFERGVKEGQHQALEGNEVKAMLRQEFLRGRDEGAKEALGGSEVRALVQQATVTGRQEGAKEALGGSEVRALIQQATVTGREQGREAAFGEFSGKFQPFVEKDDGFFSCTATSGYTMQLFLRGLPVGDASRRVLELDRKVDKEMIKEVAAAVLTVVNPMVGELAAAGIRAQALEVKETAKT